MDFDYQYKPGDAHTYVPSIDEKNSDHRRKFQPHRDILGEDALLDRNGLSYLVDGLLTDGGLTVAFGPAKTGGKTSFWLRLARRLSQGMPVFRRAVRACPVLYVATEGQASLRDRIEALRYVEGPAPDLHTITSPLNLLDRRDIDALVWAATESFELIVIDTLGRMIGAAGADENSSDMQRLIANLDLIRAATDAQIVLVHHSNKGGAGGPRGHSSLIGAADLVVEHAKLGDGSRTATVTASRDNAEGLLMRYRLRPIDLPATRWCPARSAVIAEEVDEPLPVPVAKVKRGRRMGGAAEHGREAELRGPSPGRVAGSSGPPTLSPPL